MKKRKKATTDGGVVFCDPYTWTFGPDGAVEWSPLVEDEPSPEIAARRDAMLLRLLKTPVK